MVPEARSGSRRRHLSAVGLVVVAAVLAAAAGAVGVVSTRPLVDADRVMLADQALDHDAPTQFAPGALPRFAPADPHDARLRSGFALPLVAVIGLVAAMAAQGGGRCAHPGRAPLRLPNIVAVPTTRAPPACS